MYQHLGKSCISSALNYFSHVTETMCEQVDELKLYIHSLYMCKSFNLKACDYHFICHNKTDHDRTQILTHKGQQQAERTGHFLSTQLHGPIHIYSSNLS